MPKISVSSLSLKSDTFRSSRPEYLIEFCQISTPMVMAYKIQSVKLNCELPPPSFCHIQIQTPQNGMS